MSRIGGIIQFSSPSFPPRAEDDELVNSDTMHGYGLAKYVADNLPAHGFEDVAMIPEDFGWWCPVANDGYTLVYVCCSENRSDDFSIFVHPDRPIIRKWFKKIDVSERVSALNDAIFDILDGSGKATSGPTWVT